MNSHREFEPAADLPVKVFDFFPAVVGLVKGFRMPEWT